MDSVLTLLGRQQADGHARLLAPLDIQAIFASPLKRARQTAEIIRETIDRDIQYDPRIMEWDCGDWSGYLYEEVQRKWPDEWAALQADRFNYRGPRCENYPDMIERATPFVQEMMRVPADNIAIVSHGMIGRVMIGILMEFGEAEMLNLAHPNDVVYRVRLSDQAEENQDRELHHFIAAEGPFEGIVERW